MGGDACPRRGWRARAGDGPAHRRELAQDKSVAARTCLWSTSISGDAVRPASCPTKLRHQSGMITLGSAPALATDRPHVSGRDGVRRGGRAELGRGDAEAGVGAGDRVSGDGPHWMWARAMQMAARSAVVAHRVRIVWGCRGHPAPMRRLWNWPTNLLPERPPSARHPKTKYSGARPATCETVSETQSASAPDTATVVRRDRPLWAWVTRAEGEVGS